MYDISKFLLLVISPLSACSKFIIKDSKHFVSPIKNLMVGEKDVLVSFDMANLFRSFPVDFTSNVVREIWDWIQIYMTVVF